LLAEKPTALDGFAGLTEASYDEDDAEIGPCLPNLPRNIQE
jgi:hypothetical protein